MDFYSSTSISSKIYENDNLVDYTDFNSNYDGENFQAQYQNNDTIYYTKLNNNELSKLMLLPNDKYNLDVRLLYDFPVTSKKSKGKTLSKKNTKKNTSVKNKSSINDTIY